MCLDFIAMLCRSFQAPFKIFICFVAIAVAYALREFNQWVSKVFFKNLFPQFWTLYEFMQLKWNITAVCGCGGSHCGRHACCDVTNLYRSMQIFSVIFYLGFNKITQFDLWLPIERCRHTIEIEAYKVFPFVYHQVYYYRSTGNYSYFPFDMRKPKRGNHWWSSYYIILLTAIQVHFNQLPTECTDTGVYSPTRNNFVFFFTLFSVSSFGCGHFLRKLWQNAIPLDQSWAEYGNWQRNKIQAPNGNKAMPEANSTS